VIDKALSSVLVAHFVVHYDEIDAERNRGKLLCVPSLLFLRLEIQPLCPSVSNHCGRLPKGVDSRVDYAIPMIQSPPPNMF
jgi:hypothetical protein